MATPLSEPLRALLIRYGHPRAKVQRWTRDTRLYHDLNWWGDNLYDDLTVIFRHFNVDASEFALRETCPGNFGLDPLIQTTFGWTEWGRRIKDKYRPVTFRMTEDAIERGRW